MHRKSYCAALAAAALLVATTQFVKADSSLGVEGGDSGGITFSGSDFDITDGITFDTTTYDTDPYTFTLDMTLQPGYTTNSIDVGLSEITGTYTGDYTFSDGPTNVSTGTITADADFYDYNGQHYFLTLSNGLLTQTSGTGFDIFPTGTTSYSLSGMGLVESNTFDGTLAPAVSAVPLPASAVMGASLLTILGASVLARRRSTKAAFAISQ